MDRHANRFLMAQSGPGQEGILDVKLQGVVFPEHSRDPALGVVGVGFRLLLLGHQGHPAVLRGPEGEEQTGQSASDDQIIRKDRHLGFGAPLFRGGPPKGHPSRL